ncbi:hypothetical protein B7494_g7029 [Chlorociboria aeruginascens]|nr:hypothetical protein B7494_g7029 [Chlorociboria aeruginascens]
MADIQASPDHDEEFEGASPGEQIIEACRRNNTDLLTEVIMACESPEKAVLLLNETKTVMGNYIYHEAALRGNYEVIDMLLDQEGFECDPINRMEGDTPLHSIVRWINQEGEPAHEYGAEIIDMMLEAGSDPRIRNIARLTPEELVDPANVSLRRRLQVAASEHISSQWIDVEKHGLKEEESEEEDDDYEGSGSDSDFDPEEFKREKERRKKEKEALANGVGTGVEVHAPPPPPPPSHSPPNKHHHTSHTSHTSHHTPQVVHSHHDHGSSGIIH